MTTTSATIVNQSTAENVAADATGAMDMAHNMLAAIFGVNFDTLYTTSNSGSIGGNTWSALFQLLGYMNSVTLMFISILIFYVLSVGVLGSASEGEPLGKKYSTLWMPLRTVFSVSLLMPIPGLSGISLMQAVLLLCISVGSMAANKMWEISLDYMSANQGSLVSGLSIDEVSTMYAVSNSIMASEMAQSYFKYSGLPVTESWSRSNINGAVSTTSGSVMDESGKYIFTFTAPSNYPSLNNEMGSITVKCQSKASSICQARHDAVIDAVNAFSAPAAAIVLNEVAVPPDIISKFLTAYEAKMKAAIESNITGTKATELQTLTDEFVTRAKVSGWSSAGSWYWVMAGLQESASAETTNYITSKPPNEESMKGIGLTDYTVFRAAQAEYLSKTTQTMDNQDLASNLKSAKDDSVWGKVSGWLSTPTRGIINSITKALTNGDPISSLKVVGDLIIDACGSIFLLAAGAATFSSGVEAVANAPVVSTMSLGVAAGAATALNTGIIIAGALATTYLLPLLTMGLTLAYYLPSIPFVLFTMATINWLILIIESLGAAPFWCMGMSFPEGEGMAGQHGRQGYLLFLGVLIRPPLMIFGFFSCFALLKIVSWLIGTTFSTYVGGVTAGVLVGPITVLAMVAILTAVIVESAHRVFSLITHLPDNVMKWIGGGSSGMGEERSAGTIKSGMMYAGGQLSGASSQGAQAGLKAVQNGKKKGGNDKKDETDNSISSASEHEVGSTRPQSQEHTL